MISVINKTSVRNHFSHLLELQRKNMKLLFFIFVLFVVSAFGSIERIGNVKKEGDIENQKIYFMENYHFLKSS